MSGDNESRCESIPLMERSALVLEIGRFHNEAGGGDDPRSYRPVTRQKRTLVSSTIRKRAAALSYAHQNNAHNMFVRSANTLRLLYWYAVVIVYCFFPQSAYSSLADFSLGFCNVLSLITFYTTVSVCTTQPMEYFSKLRV